MLSHVVQQFLTKGVDFLCSRTGLGVLLTSLSVCLRLSV